MPWMPPFRMLFPSIPVNPVLFACLCCLWLASPGSAHDDRIRDHPVFPLAKGAQWEYRSGEQQLTVRVTGYQRAGDLQAAMLETLNRDGTRVGTEHVAVKDDGIYRFTLNNNKVDPPVCFLKLPARKGESWKIEARLEGETIRATLRVGEEDVTVPAGRFKAITVSTEDGTVNDTPLRFTTWYAEGVGMVKQVIHLNGSEVRLELTKYTPGR